MSYRALILCLFASLQSVAATESTDDRWSIEARVEPGSPFYGATVANGQIGIVVSDTPLRAERVINGGLYDIYGRGNVLNYLEGFDCLFLTLEIDGKVIDCSTITDHVQTLQMRRGELAGRFVVNGSAVVNYIFCALRHRPHSAMLSVEIEAVRNISIEGRTTLSTPAGFRDTKFNYQNVGGIGLLSAVADTPTRRHKLSATSSFIFEHTKRPELKIANDSSYCFTSKAQKGQRFSFAVVGSTISTVSHPDPFNQSQRLNLMSALDGIEKLQSAHRKQWDKLWQSDIVIETNSIEQRDIRSMIYNLYSSVREGSAISVSPMGLSSTYYNGHIFWDADTWVLPALLMLHPGLGKSLIDYRINRLEDARLNAFINGYKGAQFPWESADSGVEQTPVFALTGAQEHHITACVALGVWDYFRVSADTSYLRNKGYELIAECANFWLSRVEKNSNGLYEILNVVGADEYAENVDNDAFTNAAAIKNLTIATQAAHIVGQVADTMWNHVAKRLVIDRQPGGITLEHSSYNGQIIKQVDVNLLSYPLYIITDKDQMMRDLNYYQRKIADQTPAMTHSILAVISAMLGDGERAYNFFVESYRPNMLPPFGVLAETRGGANPYFITAAGGSLQAVMMGFGGLRITDKGVIETGQTLPNHWKSLKIMRAKNINK